MKRRLYTKTVRQGLAVVRGQIDLRVEACKADPRRAEERDALRAALDWIAYQEWRVRDLPRERRARQDDRYPDTRG